MVRAQAAERRTKDIDLHIRRGSADDTIRCRRERDATRDPSEPTVCQEPSGGAARGRRERPELLPDEAR